MWEWRPVGKTRRVERTCAHWIELNDRRHLLTSRHVRFKDFWKQFDNFCQFANNFKFKIHAPTLSIFKKLNQLIGIIRFSAGNEWAAVTFVRNGRKGQDMKSAVSKRKNYTNSPTAVRWTLMSRCPRRQVPPKGSKAFCWLIALAQKFFLKNGLFMVHR